MPRRGMSNEPNWAERTVGGHGPPYGMVGETLGGRGDPLSPEAGGRECQTNPICSVSGLKTRVAVKTKPIFVQALRATGTNATAIGKPALAGATCRGAGLCETKPISKRSQDNGQSLVFEPGCGYAEGRLPAAFGMLAGSRIRGTGPGLRKE